MRYRSNYVVILATLVVFVAIVPIIYLIIRAFGSDAAFFDVLFRFSTVSTILRTWLLIVAVTLTSGIIAVPLAWLTTNTDLRFGNAIGALLTLTLALPSFVLALTFVEIYGPRGILQDWLGFLFGVERLPSIYGFWGAWIVLVFLTYPYAYLFIRSAMLRMDPGLEEAARMLGRSRLRAFTRATLPLLKPAFFSSGVLTALYVLSDFGVVSLLRYDTFTTIIFQQYTSSINLSLAAGLSAILTFFAILIVLFERRPRSGTHRKSTAFAMRQTKLVKLGLWQLPILILLGAVLGLVFVSHGAVLIYWLVRGLLAGNSVMSILQPTLNSFIVSFLAACVATVMAFPVAAVTATQRGWYAGILQRLVLLGFGLPGIVVAIALVFFGIAILGFVYQTVWLLVFGYVIAFISIPVATIRTSLLQINPRLDEVAASLGRRQFDRLLFVMIPLIMPGVLIGGIFVFLFAMKELPITLVLSPAGYQTLASAIWSNASEGFFARTALACLTLVIIGLPFAYLVTKNSHRLN